jgi:cytochrome c oxidase subunit 2
MTRLVRPKLLLPLGLLVAVLASASSALAGNGGFAPVPPESPNADGITQSYWFITALILGIFVLVEGLLVAFVIRFRRSRHARDADGAQIHGSSRLETMWTVGPVLVLFAIAAFVFAKLPGIIDVPEATAGDDRLVIEVRGQRYYWEYRYPNGVVAVERLRAPVGEPVVLRVTAPEWDVIHSWWIPALGGKMDAIPGRVNETWFQAQRVGVFQGQCAELCGLQHAAMLAEVEVMPRATFDAWLAGQADAQAAGSSDLGEETYNGACANCHGLAGQGGVAAGAPRLAGSAVASDPRAVATIVRGGRNAMPPVGREWSTTQMDALTAYLKERFAETG